MELLLPLQAQIFWAYILIAAIVAVLYLCFRERPNGSYLMKEEGIGMTALGVGLLWPVILVFILLGLVVLLTTGKR